MKYLPKLPKIKHEALPEVDHSQHEVLVLYSKYRANKNRNRAAIRKDRKPMWIFLISYLAIYVVIFIATMVYAKQFMAIPGIQAIVASLYVLFIPLMLLSLMVCVFKLCGPTAIQTGKNGIRFHWAHYLKTYSSPWISWDSVDYVSSELFTPERVSFPKLEQTQSFDISVDISKVPEETRKFIGVLKLFGHQKKTLDKYNKVIRIDQGSFIHEDDVPRFLASVKHFLSDEKVDPTCSETMIESKDRSYTSIWLEQFDGTRESGLLEPLPENSSVGQGKYKVIEVLAAGGHAVTYKALQEESDDSKFIALKEIVLPVAGGREIRKRALENVKREAELLKRLDHPKVVKCLDVFTEGHKAYICLNFIEGSTLRDFVTESGPVNETTARQLAGQMCEILQYLHSQEPPVLHRDFTPDNLMLGPDNSLTLIDFNVAEQREGFETATVVGKHCYIPPEQFRGKPSRQSDIYALGCSVFWLVTGCDPEPISTSHPRSVNDCISEVLDDFVAGATYPDASKRYKSVKELKEHRFLKDLLFNTCD